MMDDDGVENEDRMMMMMMMMMMMGWKGKIGVYGVYEHWVDDDDGDDEMVQKSRMNIDDPDDLDVGISITMMMTRLSMI